MFGRPSHLKKNGMIDLHYETAVENNTAHPCEGNHRAGHEPFSWPGILIYKSYDQRGDYRRKGYYQRDVCDESIIQRRILGYKIYGSSADAAEHKFQFIAP